MTEAARFRVGVDVGGTFTDLAVLETSTNELQVYKVPTTPQDPSVGVLNGLKYAEEASPTGFRISKISDFLHGTTITTNALIEGNYVPCALLITEGLRGSIQVQEQARHGNLFDLTLGHPDSLVDPRHIFEVPERVDFAGKVIRDVDEAAVRIIAERISALGLSSVTVCLLFSFVNPGHERRVRGLLHEVAPDLRVTLSSEVLPRIREWPRISTLLASASLEPLLVDYVRRLADALGAEGLGFDQLFLMESNGGLMPFRAVINGGRAVHTLLSGPAAAVQGALSMVRTVDQDRLITLDIGGTSADIAVVDDTGALEVTEGRLVGHDIYVPMLDITTIGAGGGTISRVASDGRLLVGPASAGAEPGPACYSKGGTMPTTTDADLVLGRLNPGYYLGGRMSLDPGLAAAAIEEHVAGPLGIDVLEAAEGMVRINDLHMADAIRVYAAQKGLDLTASTLVPCGGAGPLHAAGVASELRIQHIIVPPEPGVFSAVGLLCSDVVQDFVQSDITMLAAENVDLIGRQFHALELKALSELMAQGFAAESIHCEREVDARYAGQGFELRIPAGGDLSDVYVANLVAAFHESHRRTYGHAATEERVEIVSCRVRARVEMAKYQPVPIHNSPRERPLSRDELPTRPVHHAGEWQQAAVISRSELHAGDHLSGSVVVEQPDTTTFVPSGWELTCDPYGNLDLRRA